MPPYTFDWDNDGTGDFDDPEDILGQKWGSRNCTVKDANGDTESIFQFLSPGYNMSASVQTLKTCPGESQGVIEIAPWGAGGPIQIDWEIDGFGNWDNDTIQTGLTAGVYGYILLDSLGCTDTFSLTINTHPQPFASVSNIVDSLVADQPGTYQWVECPSFNIIPGATDQYYIATLTGEYAVILTDNNGCSDTSLCVPVDFTKQSEFDPSLIKLWPNPANEYVTINLPDHYDGTINYCRYKWENSSLRANQICGIFECV